MIDGNNKELQDTWLYKYREAIRSGEIIAGADMVTELDNLIHDFLMNPEYHYNTEKADIRIDFIESCVRLTKAPFYNKPMKLLLWEKAFIEAGYSFEIKSIDSGEWIQRFQEILLLITRKNGKALSLDCDIPTPSGWKKMKDIHVGDYVFTQSGKPTKVLVESQIFEKPMYRVFFEDGSFIDASKDHIWRVQTKSSRRMANRILTKRRRTKPDKFKNGGWYDTTTEEMINDYFHVRKDGKGIEYKYRVPMANAVEYPKKDLKIDPYTFGVWLGDGCKNHTGITCSEEDKNELMDPLQKKGHTVKYTRPDKSRAGTIWIDTVGGNKTLLSLKELGVFKNKHIPEEYLQSSISQRMELLRGLMDTDGTCNKAGQCEFTQKSKELAYSVLELIRSLGIKATIREKKAVCNGVDCGIVYRIMFFTSKDFSCFHLKRKHERLKDELCNRTLDKSIVRIESIEMVKSKCIAVEDESHLYLAGNAFTVTHNTELIAALQLTELILGGTGKDIICSGTNDGTADLAYQAIDTMRLLIDPKSIDTWRNQKGIKCFLNNNHIYKLSDSTRQKEGRNIDMAGIDEIWSLEDDGIYKPIQQSTSTKDEFKIFMFGSEGFVDDGFLDQKRKEYTAIIYGEDDTDAAKRKLPWIYSQDSESEVWNTGADGISRLWEKSNPSIGTVKKYSYLKDRVDEARKSKSDRAFVLAKDFNFKVNNSEAWLLSELVEYLGEYQLDNFRGTIALGSVDLAETTDLCSAKALIMLPDDDTKYFRSMYWIPESKLELSPDTEAGARYKEWAREGLIRIVEGNDIDISLVADWFYELHREEGITVYKVGYDQKFSKEFLNRMEEYGFDTEIILQNRYALSNPMRLVETELKKHLINCNDNPIDKWCLKNTAVQVWDTGHIMPIKQKGQSAKRIDGSLTFIMCYEMLRRYRSDYKILVDRKRG